MMYHISVFVSAFLFSSGIIVFRKSFFDLSLHTVSLLDTLLALEEEDILRQKQLIRKTGKTLQSITFFLLCVLITLIVAFGPIWVYTWLTDRQPATLNPSSITFGIVAVLGSTVPFFVFSPKSRHPYNEISILLHQLALDHYNVARHLFFLEKRCFSKKIYPSKENFFIVSGLARSGTTALTKLLYQSGSFHTLTYANMPFLLCPNLWKRCYHPPKHKAKERRHGDNIWIDYRSVAALEEYYFKMMLQDSFITDHSLYEHVIEKDTYKAYLDYQRLIGSTQANKPFYLAKNNNLILRYRSLRSYNENFWALFLFREPIQHALSLHKQHQNFTQQQNESPFILTYMDWLGHHEFGRHHKPFSFDTSPFTTSFSPTSINYWLEIWIYYYTYLLELIPLHDNTLLIHYEDFLTNPHALINTLQDKIGISLTTLQITKFSHKTHPIMESIDPVIQRAAEEVYDKLIDQTFQLT